MKKFLSILFLIPLLFIAPVVRAQDQTPEPQSVSTEEVNTLESSQTHEGDYFTVGERNEISGTVNGDVYSFGGQVNFDGKVNGDFIVAGGTVAIDGEVTGDVRVGGGTVTISNKIGRNLTLLGGTVEVTSSGNIAGSVVGAAGNLNFNGPVAANIRVGSGNLSINNRVGGNVNAAVGQLRLGSKADIVGNLTYWSDQEVSRADGAKVAGTVTKKAAFVKTDDKSMWALPTAKQLAESVQGLFLFFRILDFLTLLVVGVLLLLFAPNLNDRVQETIKKKHWLSLGIGLAGWFLIPIVTIALLITVVGIPVSLILGVWYLITIYLARLFAIIWLGKFIVDGFKWNFNRYGTFFLGLVIFAILSVLGFVGVIVNIVAFLFGFGALLITSKNLYSESRSKKLI